MNSSILNGLNIGKVEFNKFITFRPTKNISLGKREDHIKYILNGTNYSYCYYCFERDRYSNRYHVHLLLKCDNNKFDEALYANIKGYGGITIGKREAWINTQQNLIGKKGDKKMIRLVDEKIQVVFRGYRGRLGTIHVEKIESNIGTALYTSKFTNSGIVSGYIVN